MDRIVKKTLSFVKSHDANPKNNRAERIPAEKVTPELIKGYLDTVFSEYRSGKNSSDLNRAFTDDTSGFHSANETFFKYLPPKMRHDAFKWLRKNCEPYVKSAVCDSTAWDHVPKEPFVCKDDPWKLGGSSWKEFKCQKEREFFKGLKAFKDLDKIPVITKKTLPHIYRIFRWMIKTSRGVSLNEFADDLEKKLNNGQLRYLEDLNFALAFADPREPGIVVFGKSFYERTWADEIDWMEVTIDVKDQEIIEEYWKLSGESIRNPSVPSFITLEYLRKLANNNPQKPMHPKTLRKRLLEHKKRLKKEREEKYRFYYGNLDPKTFSPHTPLWMITIPHEIRHTQQMKQDVTRWKPDWSRGRKVPGRSYYTILSQWSIAMKLNFPHHAVPRGRVYTLNNEVDNKLKNLGSVRERDASKYGIKIAKKLDPAWKKSIKRDIIFTFILMRILLTKF